MAVGWAVRACCDDARAYGLLKDPRINSLAQIISPQAIEQMLTEDLKVIHRLFEMQLTQPETEHLDDGKKILRPKSGFYTVGIGEPNQYKVQRPSTARESLEIIENAKAAHQNFTIRDLTGVEIIELGPRQLAEREDKA